MRNTSLKYMALIDSWIRDELNNHQKLTPIDTAKYQAEI
jgi:hypothetical protein